jgi:hypothetical protein
MSSDAMLQVAVITTAQRARRRFFKRIWRSLRGFLFGFEIAKVTVPTRRTFHSEAAGVP